MTSFESRHALVDLCEQIVPLYEKLLVLRLMHVAQTISDKATDRPERIRFIERWSSLARLSPTGLHRASRDPHLASWVGTAEALIRSGIDERYPDAHPKRHLDGFGCLVLCWAAELPDGSHGLVNLAGRTGIDLMFGDAVLLGPISQSHRTLSWHTRDGALRIELSDAEPIVEMSLSDLADIDVAHDDWRCIQKPRAGPITVDPWTWPRLNNDLQSVDAHPLQDVMLQAVTGIPDEILPVLESTCRSITMGATGAQWIAGLLSLRDGAAPGSREVVELACFDLVSRHLSVRLTTEVFPRPVRVELARRAAALLYGEDPDAAADPESNDRWGALLSRAREITGELGLGNQKEGCAMPEPSMATTTVLAAESDLVLPIGDVGMSGAPQPLLLKKTRRGAESNVNDFVPLNFLSSIPESVVRSVLDKASAASRGSEGAAYLAAACAYVTGEFQTCVRALSQCIHFDPDVEEYWHLLAFALRYLGRYQEFGEIMFGGVRDTNILTTLKRSLGGTT